MIYGIVKTTLNRINGFSKIDEQINCYIFSGFSVHGQQWTLTSAMNLKINFRVPDLLRARQWNSLVLGFQSMSTMISPEFLKTPTGNLV